MPPVLAGIRLKLRPPSDADVLERLALGRVPEFVRLVGGEPGKTAAPFTHEEARAQIDALMGRDAGWAIEFEGRFVGTVFLHSLDRATGEPDSLSGYLTRRCGAAVWERKQRASCSPTPSAIWAFTASTSAR